MACDARQNERMRGYHDASYGDAFADVYDEWYHDVSDVGATTDTIAALASACATPRVLELGVGTGRLALPLAARGLEVHGLDTSDRMLAALAAKSDGASVITHLADMVDGLPAGPFGVVFVAYNTFFSLLTAERQQACFSAVAERLAPDGMFVIEAIVPATQPDRAAGVTVRTMAADRVVLSVNTADAAEQRAEGQYVEFTDSGGVRLRPWSIRWATPAQLDRMATNAHLHLSERWEDFGRSPFVHDSPQHVSVYSRLPGRRLSLL